MYQQMHNWSTIYCTALYYTAYTPGWHNNSTNRQIVFMATTLYFLRIPRQNTCITAGTILKFLMIYMLTTKHMYRFKICHQYCIQVLM